MDGGAFDLDKQVRLAAFAYLAEQVQEHGEVLPYATLFTGFTFKGTRVPLIGPQGIFKPAVLPEMPLSITTAPVLEGRPRPYADEIREDGTIIYRYRGTDPAHHQNVGLRLAMMRQVPLIYFHGIIRGRYFAEWPVYITDDDPGQLCVRVKVEDKAHVSFGKQPEAGIEARRQYITTVTQRRLHQESFRQRVLQAYQTQCAICRLRHAELLEAAHILPDGHPKGEPIVPNGLALCTLHHAAFDRHILGVRPDLVVEVRHDILREGDGPMLKHGLQGFQGSRILIPQMKQLRPNPDFLAERYALFQRAA